jgi:hypothetical protein
MAVSADFSKGLRKNVAEPVAGPSVTTGSANSDSPHGAVFGDTAGRLAAALG